MQPDEPSVEDGFELETPIAAPQRAPPPHISLAWLEASLKEGPPSSADVDAIFDAALDFVREPTPSDDDEQPEVALSPKPPQVALETVPPSPIHAGDFIVRWPENDDGGATRSASQTMLIQGSSPLPGSPPRWPAPEPELPDDIPLSPGMETAQKERTTGPKSLPVSPGISARQLLIHNQKPMPSEVSPRGLLLHANRSRRSGSPPRGLGPQVSRPRYPVSPQVGPSARLQYNALRPGSPPLGPQPHVEVSCFESPPLGPDMDSPSRGRSGSSVTTMLSQFQVVLPESECSEVQQIEPEPKMQSPLRPGSPPRGPGSFIQKTLSPGSPQRHAEVLLSPINRRRSELQFHRPSSPAIMHRQQPDAPLSPASPLSRHHSSPSGPLPSIEASSLPGSGPDMPPACVELIVPKAERTTTDWCEDEVAPHLARVPLVADDESKNSEPVSTVPLQRCPSFQGGPSSPAASFRSYESEQPSEDSGVAADSFPPRWFQDDQGAVPVPLPSDEAKAILWPSSSPSSSSASSPFCKPSSSPIFDAKPPAMERDDEVETACPVGDASDRDDSATRSDSDQLWKKDRVLTNMVCVEPVRPSKTPPVPSESTPKVRSSVGPDSEMSHCLRGWELGARLPPALPPGPDIGAASRANPVTSRSSEAKEDAKDNKRGHGFCRAAAVVDTDVSSFSTPAGHRPSKAVSDESSDSSSKPELVPVTLHVYDLTWLTQWLSLPIFHLGVEVHNREYSFGTTAAGIISHRPGANDRAARKREVVPLGYTHLSGLEVLAVIKKLSAEWPASSYDLLRRNCCTFTMTFCRHLGVEHHIPPEYTRFAEFGASSLTGAQSASDSRTLAPTTLSCSTAKGEENKASRNPQPVDLIDAEQSRIVKVVPVMKQ